MKKLVSILIIAVMLVTIGLPVSAAKNGDIEVYLKRDGEWEKIWFDVQPQIINDRTMVPIRAVAEAMEYSVDWISETKTVSISTGCHQSAYTDFEWAWLKLFEKVAEGKAPRNFTRLTYPETNSNISIYDLTKPSGWDLSINLFVGRNEHLDMLHASNSTIEASACTRYITDVPPQIVNDRTLVPLRAAAEMLGLNVNWDGNNRIVYLSID